METEGTENSMTIIRTKTDPVLCLTSSIQPPTSLFMFKHALITADASLNSRDKKDTQRSQCWPGVLTNDLFALRQADSWLKCPRAAPLILRTPPHDLKMCVFWPSSKKLTIYSVVVFCWFLCVSVVTLVLWRCVNAVYYNTLHTRTHTHTLNRVILWQDDSNNKGWPHTQIIKW